MTKATLSLPSPKPRSSRQKKKPWPPAERAGFQAHISAGFTGVAASVESVAARGRVSIRKQQQQSPQQQQSKPQHPTKSKPQKTTSCRAWWQTSGQGDMRWRWAGCAPGRVSSQAGKPRSKSRPAWVNDGAQAPAL